MKIKLTNINYIIFLLAISTTLVALPDLLIPLKIPYKEFFITPLLEIFFIAYLFYNKEIFINKKFFKIYFIFVFPIFMLYLLEPIRYNLEPGRNVIYILINFFNILIFFIFYNISINRKDFFYNSIKLFWKFNHLIALAALFIFLLLTFDIIGEKTWGLPSWFNDNFQRKLLMDNAPSDRYDVPFLLTVILTDYVKPFGIFSQFGSFAGLSYESHLATYFMSPAFFLTFYFYKISFKNFIIYVLPFIIFFLLSASLTNLISLLLVGSILFFFNISIKKFLKIFIFFLFIFLFLFFSGDLFMEYKDTIYAYIDYKFNSRSNEESSGFINYILSPNSIFGWGVFNIPTYFTKNNFNDIGLINTFLIVLFFLQLLYLSVKNLFYKNYTFAAIGFYIFIHSLKFPMHIFLYPYLLFIIALLLYPLSTYRFLYKNIKIKKGKQ